MRGTWYQTAERYLVPNGGKVPGTGWSLVDVDVGGHAERCYAWDSGLA